ncbi:MAG TPA: hypothetical protein VM221_08195 [Armatimonadota bacterium]|nr:hypothetical protein [Armatimonadota bacterium]
MRTRKWTIVVTIYVMGGLIGAVAWWALVQALSPIFRPVEGGAFYGAVSASVLLWAAVMYLLHRLPASVKKRVVVFMTFVAGLFYTLEFYLPEKSAIFFWRPSHTNPFTPMLDPVGAATSVIFGFTFFLGAFSLSLVHGKHIAARRPGYYNSIAFFVAFAAMAAFGLWQAYAPKAILVHDHWGLRNLSVRQVYDYLFISTYVPLGAALFSVLAFYMATAAFRAFRVRSAEAGFMMVAAFICMLGQVPLGMWVTHHLPMTGPLSHLRTEAIANWILGVFSMAGLRAVGFGILVGGLAMSLRLWLNLERGAFFEQEL